MWQPCLNGQVVVQSGLMRGGDCTQGVWAHSRDAIVSDADLLPPPPGGYGHRAQPPTRPHRVEPPTLEELQLLRGAVERGTMMPLTRNQTAAVNHLLERFSGEPLLPVGILI